jgi:ABC-type Fe3+ transport system substrate-binding protein
MKKLLSAAVLTVCAAIMFGSCSGSKKQIVFYSNADDEAMASMKKALDEHGFAGKYIEQSYGTSELGGKLMAEGTDIEADLITMSTFYINSAQQQNKMFRDLTFSTEPLTVQTPYQAPVVALLGAILVNTKLMESSHLPMPVSIKDLGNPEYKGNVSVVDPMGSSTAWLLLQAVIGTYGEDGAKDVLTAIYRNAGAQLELSGSGPLKKIRAGEAALGFGLRHQAVADQKKGLPITFVDPAEGNYVLTESVAVIEKGKKTNPLAMEMAECIVKYGRPLIIQDYPVALYKGETVAPENQVASKIYPEPLTVELLKKHQALSESCKTSN